MQTYDALFVNMVVNSSFFKFYQYNLSYVFITQLNKQTTKFEFFKLYKENVSLFHPISTRLFTFIAFTT